MLLEDNVMMVERKGRLREKTANTVPNKKLTSRLLKTRHAGPFPQFQALWRMREKDLELKPSLNTETNKRILKTEQWEERQPNLVMNKIYPKEECTQMSNGYM